MNILKHQGDVHSNHPGLIKKKHRLDLLSKYETLLAVVVLLRPVKEQICQPYGDMAWGHLSMTKEVQLGVKEKEKDRLPNLPIRLPLSVQCHTQHFK